MPVIGDFGAVARYIDDAGFGHNFAKISLLMQPSTGFHWNIFSHSDLSS